MTSYQTAWTWLHKLRRATVRPGREPLMRKVEVDDGYVGGEESGVRRETKNKAVVAVAVKGQAAGRLRMERVENALASSLRAFVVDNVAPGSTLRTDGWSSYEGLHKEGYRHRPRVIGGDPKRWLLGTHRGAVRPHHLSAYLDEFMFRYNRRFLGARDAGLPTARVSPSPAIEKPIEVTNKGRRSRFIHIGPPYEGIVLAWEPRGSTG